MATEDQAVKARTARTILLGALFSLVTSSVLLAWGVPFMKTWYYSFAWWSSILALDGLNFRRAGRSPLFDSTPGFFLAAFLSIPIWLVFELFNLRLDNWSYHGLPRSLAVRWPGYALAFATVVPALIELEAFVRGFFAKREGIMRPRHLTAAFLNLSSAAGIFCLILPLLFPRLFFPLVWLGFFFLLEPVNCRAGRPSLFRELEAGRATRTLSWMAAGLAAGILWEIFNFWAGSHWEYAIPHLGFGRVFQMPILGYGGFIPFALEIEAMLAALAGVSAAAMPSRALRTVFFGGLIAFDLACFYLIDVFSLAR